MSVTRRSFLTYLGTGAAALLAARTPAADFPAKRRKGPPPPFFTPIEPSGDDRLKVAKEFEKNWSVVIRWDDPLGSNAPDGSGEKFGFNNDFIAAFRRDALTTNASHDDLVLWVNHEYPNPLFVSGYTPADYKANRKKTAEQIEAERRSVGGSVVQVKRQNGTWAAEAGAKLNRRFTAAYPQIGFSGPAAEMLGRATGTLANCSGGVTPWHTVLSCEENYPDFNPYDPKDFFYRWNDVPALAVDETKYGWVLEVDPFGELPPVKHTALGRFKHENAAVRVSKGGRLVVYMGDDEADQHLYKFVSDGTVKDGASRKEQRKLLEAGTLYAADMGKGRWIPLVWDDTTKTLIHGSAAYAEARKKDETVRITGQAELLLHTRVAARALGATPLDRCEDCELHPDNTLYVAMTNNTRHGNLYGHVVRLREKGDDLTATEFEYEVFLAGGPQTGLACPDNLAFDPHGNLWVVCDTSSDKLGKGAYRPFANNGLFVVPTTGGSAGDAFQFASGPVECELTGPCFSPDGSTLFLAVQHPGENSETADQPTSRWPDGKGIPRPAVVAVTGFTW